MECHRHDKMVVMHAFSKGNCTICDKEIQTPHIPCNKVCPVCSENHRVCEICGAEIPAEIMEKLEKLKQDMLAAKANRQEFIDKFKKPATDDSDIPVIELKTHKDALELKRLTDEMHSKYKAYVDEMHSKYKAYVDEWQKTKDKGIDHE